MVDSTQSTAARPAQQIIGEDGFMVVLAATEADALAYAVDYHGGDAVRVEADGWWMNVGWDRDRYEFKREFVAESGYSSWWENFTGRPDQTETAKCRRGWKVHRVAS